VFLEVELFNCRYDPKIRVADPHSLSADLDKALLKTWEPDYRYVGRTYHSAKLGTVRTYLPVCEIVFMCYFNFNHVQLKSLVFSST
jgi:hypothetical protein